MSDTVLISIISGGVVLVAAIIGGIITIKVTKIQQVQKSISVKQNDIAIQIDGRMEELLKLTRAAHEAIGNLQGREELKNEQNVDGNK